MIKEFIQELRTGISDIIRPKGDASLGRFLSTGFNAWDVASGQMQPTDFVKQCASNTSWVYACVAAIAETCAAQPLKLYVKKGLKVEEVTEHIFLDVVQNVNPFMNAFELRELTEIYQLLCGNAYWYLVKNKLNVPAEIWIVPAQYMRVVPDTTEFIKGYIYEYPGTDQIAFDADEIVHFKYPNPNNVFYGMSPLLAATYAVATDEAMNKYQVGTFANMGMPAAVLSSDQLINEADAKRMREQWKQLYGGTTKAGKIAILSKGLKFDAIQMTAQELSYIQSKNINRDTILGIFRVPKSILGLVEDVNRANAEATEYIFNLRTILPKLIRTEEKLNEKIMPLYEQPGGNYLFVKFTNPVPANIELESKLMSERLTTGYSSINEERERNGQKPVDWGDVPILQMNMVPLGSAPAEEAPEEAPPEAPKTGEEKAGTFARIKVWSLFKSIFDVRERKINAKMVGYFNKQRAEVLKNLNKAGKSIAEGIAKIITKADVDDIIFDAEDWDDELEDLIGPEQKKTYAAGIKHGKEIARLTIDFDLTNPQSLKWLKDKAHKFSFEVNDTTTNQLKEELRAGLEAGETHKQLTDRVNKVFDFAEQYRGRRIARTEVADCENKGIMDVWTESDVVSGKEWLHGGGGETPRPEHVAMSGEVVGIDETFSNGLEYPGDQNNGDASDVCNCTCTLLPITKNS